MTLDAIGDAVNYLIEETELTVSYFEGRPVAIEPPTFVELKVTMTEPMMKGATQAASPKPATLETGHTLRVPQYIGIGDRVKVDTRDGTFIERVNS
jgi:elongation factor P